MKVEIKLTQVCGKITNKEPFFVADNDNLELDIKSPTAFTELIIAAKNGKATATLKYKDKPVIVPRELYAAGYLEMRCAVINKGQTVKELDIEPIAIVEVMNGFNGSQAFSEIEKTVKKISAQFELLKQRYKEAFKEYDFFGGQNNENK